MSKLSTPISRRQFVRLTLVGAAAALVEAGCQAYLTPVPGPPAPSRGPAATLATTPTPSSSPRTTATATPIPSPTPEVVATLPPLPEDTPALLRSRNDPHYNVRYFNPFPPVDHDAWRLRVSGLVEKRINFSLDDLFSWPQMDQISRLKCVECWSYKARWGGFSYATLAERVNPLAEATHVRFDCADDYWEIVSVEELADPRVIFVLSMNEQPLLDEYGAPLRMIFPAKYGYKSAKAVTSITFSAQGGAGYWSTVGPYTGHGNIQPGADLPQDLPGQSMSIDGGEITNY
jgi:sulfoxide reductase catalytic subunit YedY